MSPSAGRRRTWVFLSHLQIFHRQFIKAVNLSTEKSWVLQERFSTHYPIYSSFLDAFNDIIKGVNASIGNYRNIHCFFYFSNHAPIACPNSLFILLFSSSMHSQQRAACSNNSVYYIKSFLFSFSDSYFAENRHLYICHKGLDNLLY